MWVVFRSGTLGNYLLRFSPLVVRRMLNSAKTWARFSADLRFWLIRLNTWSLLNDRVIMTRFFSTESNEVPLGGCLLWISMNLSRCPFPRESVLGTPLLLAFGLHCRYFRPYWEALLWDHVCRPLVQSWTNEYTAHSMLLYSELSFVLFHHIKWMLD